MKFLGIDPGVEGGAAIIELNDGATPRLVEAIDIPVIGAGAKERVDALAHSRLDRAAQTPTRLRSNARRRCRSRARSSGFKYGRAVGAIEAAIACCRNSDDIVEPSAWKRFRRLPGKDKEGGRQRALQLFPAAHAALARKKDHGRAEASLIALYGARS